MANQYYSKNILNCYRVDSGTHIKTKCAPEENKYHLDYLNKNHCLPDNVFTYDSKKFYRIDPILSPEEAQELIHLQKLSQLKTIKVCVVIMTIVTLVSILLSIIMINAIN